MAKISDVYKNYKISQSLQLHQLRVAAVAKQICDNLNSPVDTEVVVTACLLHDMGNILKFTFDSPDEWFEPEGKDYWRKVQQETAQKYDTWDEHQLSIIVAKELGVKFEVLTCIESIDFGRTIETLARPEIEPKICDYADLRVTPYGVVSLDERLEEGNKRYRNRPGKWLAEDVREKILQACHDNEDNLFASSKLKPEDITDKTTAPTVEQLKAYEI
jgi:hypothetical protein